MNPLLIVLPLLLVLGTLVYGAVRVLGRLWLDHRIQLALLEKLQEKPELLDSFQELQGVLIGVPGGYRAHRQDYTLTGIVLAVVGMGCVFAGRYLQVGRLAVGTHAGGLICIGLGVVLALLGLLVRLLERTPNLPDLRK